jgi:hypothetical protein
MDRRFICRDCGTKWFIHEHRTSEPDLTECARCGGPLPRFIDPSVEPGSDLADDDSEDR